MATAKVLASVNGAPNASGGLDIPSGAVIDLTPASIDGWKQALWEFYDYPEDWTPPPGWSVGAGGIIYSAAFVPPRITFPANTSIWGVWMLRLRVNEQTKTDGERIANLLDDTTAFSMPSPRGQRDIGARERFHFTTPTTRLKGWLRAYQYNLRTIEAQLGSGGGAPPAGANGDLQVKNGTVLGALSGADGDTLRRRGGVWTAEVGIEVPAGSNNDLIGLDATGGVKSVMPIGLGPGDLLRYDGTKLVRLPAGPNGAVLTMVAGVPAWVGGGGGFTPASLPMSLLIDSAFSASPWLGTSSAGSSGGRNLVETTNPPSVGPALNGIATSLFDGVNDQLLSSAQGNQLLTVSEWSACVLFYASALSGTHTTAYPNEALICTADELWGIHVGNVGGTTPQVQVYQTQADGSARVNAFNIVTGAWNLIQATFSGGTIRARLNSAAWVNVTSTNLYASWGAATFKVGVSASAVGGPYRFNGRLAAIGLSQSGYTDGQHDQIKTYLNSSRGLAL